MLGDDDSSSGDEATGCSAGRLHESLPVSPGFGSSDLFGGFGGAYGLVAAAFGEEGEDGGFEGYISGSGFVASAGVTAVLDDVPVLRPLLAPRKGAAVGLADLILVRGGAVGFGFAVGHGDCGVCLRGNLKAITWLSAWI